MADIEFTCPECSQALVVSCEGAGRIIACPNCSRTSGCLDDTAFPLEASHRQSLLDIARTTGIMTSA